jgi:rod shape-determining protein MreD
LIIFVSYLALREDFSLAGAPVAYLLGLVQGTFSGIQFGLAGVSMLLIYLLLNKAADQLYTDSDQLMVVVVFFATLIDAVTSLVFMLLFSTVPGIYKAFLANMVPQALVNALVASLVFGFSTLGARRERP